MSKLTLILLVFTLLILGIVRAQSGEERVSRRSKSSSRLDKPPLYYTRLEGAHTVVLKDTSLVAMRRPLRQNDFRFTTQPEKADFLMFYLQSDYVIMYDTVRSLGCPFVYSIRSIDLLAHKGAMYAHLESTLSRDTLARHVPVTWVLTNDRDRAKLVRSFDPSKLYIIKKNVQRQKGCQITRDLDEIVRAHKQNYVVCQEILTDNFMVNTRKINIRVYVVIVVHKDVRVYMYTDGFLYYGTPNYSADSRDRSAHVTTGYVDRSVYAENPLTLHDLYAYLGAPRSATLRKNIQLTVKTVARGFHDAIHEMDTEADCTNFVITGWDLSVDGDLKCKVMEINKGPDLGFKEERDENLKRDLVLQTYRIAGLLEDRTPQNMVRIV